jgi:ribonuclease HI
MELQAAIEALGALKEPSEYVKNGVTTWLPKWRTNGWRTKARKSVKNEDLWRALDVATSRHRVKWNWLKGHAGDDDNQRCDQLANEAIDQIKRSFSPEQLKVALTQFASSDDEGLLDKNASAD